MGIIVGCLNGCGRTYFTNVYKDKAKVFERRGELKNDDIDEIMNVINDHDIIFIDSTINNMELLEDRNIDFDVFYPSKKRRGEFIENQVRKHTPMKEIQELDRNFDKLIDDIEEDDSENCHKHIMRESGHFIGNDPMIMQYLDVVKNNK